MVSDLKFFAYKGCKIAAQKSACFRQILPTYQNFFGIGDNILIDQEMLCLLHVGFF